MEYLDLNSVNYRDVCGAIFAGFGSNLLSSFGYGFGFGFYAGRRRTG